MHHRRFRCRPGVVRRACIAVAAPLALAGCGGGISFGFGDDGDDRPSISVAASPNPAARGEAVTLLAAASDDWAIYRVEFYRVESDGDFTPLASAYREPYQWTTTIAADAPASVEYVARAVDDIGQTRDASVIVVVE
jgi:hypothetical protein